MSQLHKLKLHEKINPKDGLEVMRIPGGWIYRFFELHHVSSDGQYLNYVVDSVFVPFNGEFSVAEIPK